MRTFLRSHQRSQSYDCDYTHSSKARHSVTVLARSISPASQTLKEPVVRSGSPLVSPSSLKRFGALLRKSHSTSPKPPSEALTVEECQQAGIIYGTRTYAWGEVPEDCGDRVPKLECPPKSAARKARARLDVAPEPVPPIRPRDPRRRALLRSKHTVSTTDLATPQLERRKGGKIKRHKPPFRESTRFVHNKRFSLPVIELDYKYLHSSHNQSLASINTDLSFKPSYGSPNTVHSTSKLSFFSFQDENGKVKDDEAVYYTDEEPESKSLSEGSVYNDDLEESADDVEEPGYDARYRALRLSDDFANLSSVLDQAIQEVGDRSGYSAQQLLLDFPVPSRDISSFESRFRRTRQTRGGG